MMTSIKPNTIVQPASYIGVHFHGRHLIDKFWKITCPCGITVEYEMNRLPEIDTKHPCGIDNHWTVKYDE